MKLSFRPIIGALRLTGRRALEEERPGLAVWANEGERAAVAVRDHVRDQAHAAEIEDREAVKLLEEALADGIDKTDAPLIAKALRHVRRSAERDHDLGEVAT